MRAGAAEPSKALGVAAASAVLAASALFGGAAGAQAADLALGKSVFDGNCGESAGGGRFDGPAQGRSGGRVYAFACCCGGASCCAQ